MKTLVELYDAKNTIDNILAAYIFRPDHVVFLFDGQPENLEAVQKVQQALSARYPGMTSSREILSGSGQAREVFERLISLYPDPVFDLTGGQDAVSFAISMLCYVRCRPCICIDRQRGELLCSEAAQIYREQFRMPELEIEDILRANGAALLRSMHQTPPPERYDALTVFYEETLHSPKEWLSFCRYLQQMAAKADREGHPLSIQGNSVVADKNGRMFQCHPDFARLAYRLGFLTKLELEKNRVSLTFADETVLRYLTSQGTWLELYVYITAERSGCFNDCRMSTVIDWDGVFQKQDNVVNEIDVLLMCGIRPVFISCKTSVPTTENLNEIELYAKKLGGSQAVAMLVTTTDVKKQEPIVYYRARELGVILVQREVLLKENGLLQCLTQIRS